MKKIFTLLLALALLLAAMPVIAEESGMWERREYVDEFELPTGITYVSNKYPIVGKFSNSATTDSLLEAYLFYDKGIVSIRLIEYGKYIVKNTFSTTQEYDVSIMAPQGVKYALTGLLYSGSDVVSFDTDDSKTIVGALCQNGLVRFSIRDISSKYIFNIMDSTGFYNFVPFSSAMGFGDGLAPVSKGDKYGYIDTNGNLVIPYQWDEAGSFSEDIFQLSEEGRTHQGKTNSQCEKHEAAQGEDYYLY